MRGQTDVAAVPDGPNGGRARCPFPNPAFVLRVKAALLHFPVRANSVERANEQGAAREQNQRDFRRLCAECAVTTRLTWRCTCDSDVTVIKTGDDALL